MALIVVGILVTQIADLQKHIGRPIRDIREISPYALQINCSGPWCDYIVESLIKLHIEETLIKFYIDYVDMKSYI